MNMCYINSNDTLLTLFTPKTKGKKNVHRNCDNLCVEATNFKASCFTCRDVTDQVVTSQFD